jgi:2-dehydropantoate 2-reductase
MMKHLAVIGAGSIGAFVAARLAAASAGQFRVTLLAKPSQEAKLASHTLRAKALALAAVEWPDALARRREHGGERRHFQVCTDREVLRDASVVLVAVKSAQTRDVADALAGTLPAATLVVSLQNGVHNVSTLRERCSASVVSGGIVGFNVVETAPLEFAQTSTGLLILERAFHPSFEVLIRAMSLALTGQPRVRSLRARDGVGVAADIAPLQWTKLLMNLNNAISALGDQAIGELTMNPGYRRIVRAVISEGLAVMRHARIRVGQLGAFPPQLFPALLALPTPVLRTLLRAQLKTDPRARSSMWQDLSARRPTEVDHLNGEVVALAKRAGVHAPINARLVELVHAAEAAGEGSPALSAEALARELGLPQR